jgi:hypothetical protein
MAGWVSPEKRAFLSGPLLVLAQAVAVPLLGIAFHDPDAGASFWLLGLLFVAAEAVWLGIASVLASDLHAAIARRRGPPAGRA